MVKVAVGVLVYGKVGVGVGVVQTAKKVKAFKM